MNCPNCGKDVGLGRKTCPQCGFPIGLSSQLGSSIPQQVEPVEEHATQPSPRTGGQPKALVGIVAGLIIVSIAIGVFFFISQSLQNNSSDNQSFTGQNIPPVSNMTITFSDITISGNNTGQPGRSYTEICQVIYQHSTEFNEIYNQELMDDPTLKARFQVSFNINNNGTVSEVNVTGLDKNSPQLETKIKANIHQWQFAPAKGGHTSVAFVLAFSSNG